MSGGIDKIGNELLTNGSNSYNRLLHYTRKEATGGIHTTRLSQELQAAISGVGNSTCATNMNVNR